MRKLILAIVTLAVALPSMAQQARQEIRQNVRLSGSNYLAYPGPQNKSLTKAPKGYKPCYLSHYGRHGSRHLIGRGDFTMPLQTLERADSAGMLTERGKELLGQMRTIYAEAKDRLGELTLLGHQQHQQIGARMIERFPEVFEGDAVVDARSTWVVRCILSMENELHSLLRANPKLQMKIDASMADMYYMNNDDRELFKKRRNADVDKAYDAFVRRHVNYDAMLTKVFTDTAYARKNFRCSELNHKLFQIASNLQSTELRHTISLYDLFTEEEIYGNWLRENAYWYIHYGPCPLNGGNQISSQCNLVRDIIAKADSCLTLKTPGATLRFGHEVVVLPLTCLLGLNGFDQQISDLEQLEDKGWINYKVFPMGSNVQLVFYRRSATDSDVLVKFLLNEDEARLPIESDIAPYYRWSDVKNYLEKRLSQF